MNRFQLPAWVPFLNHSRKNTQRRRANPLSQLQDWQLEDRCVLSTDPLMPAATTINVNDVLYYGDDVPLKTITLTNNTNDSVYPFIRSTNSAIYDPIDATNEEYRGYVGYVDAGTNYLGLPSGTTITFNVPLVFWDGARINIGTDATNLIPSAGGPNPYLYDANADRAIVSSIDDGSSAANGLMMWYHSQIPAAPTVDSPDQLIEMTFRDPYLAQFPGVPDSETIVLINYDVSYVDSISLPVAMEAADVPIPNVTNSPLLPYGWIGAELSTEEMQQELAAFTEDNNALLGEYFDGFGWAKFYNPNEASDGIKVPSGANAIIESPLRDGRSAFDQNRYKLTSAGEGPVEFITNGTVSGTTVQINSPPADFFTFVEAGWHLTGADGPISPIEVVSVDAGNNQLELAAPVGDGIHTLTFSRPVRDHVAERIINLWYSWAKYYTDLNELNDAPAPAQGTTTTTSGLLNVLTFDAPVNGLVVGMAVSGPGIPTNTRATITGVANDNRSVTLSVLTSPDSGTYTFEKVQPIKGHDEPMTGPGQDSPVVDTIDLVFPSADQEAARLFAQGIYQIMSAMSTIPGQETALEIVYNSIGGFVGFLPNAGTADHQEVVSHFRDTIKSILRGVYDFTLFPESEWYPDPKTPTGGADYNVWNVDPFVWFVHEQLGLSGYGFSLDDDVADIGAGGASQLKVAIGGTQGLPNRYQWSWGAQYGVVETSGQVDFSNPNKIFGFNEVDYWQINPNDPTAGPGAFVAGPGIPEGTRVVDRDITNHTFILSNPVDTSELVEGNFYQFTFYGYEGDVNFSGARDRVLSLLGTEGNDRVVLSQRGDQLQLYSNFSPVSRQYFNVADYDTIYVQTFGGNDYVSVSPRVTQTVVIDGGAGRDYLRGGSGSNILIGGTGNDYLIGGRDRDILIGGDDRDILMGNGGDDVLFAGTTNYDNDFNTLNLALAEWVSNRTYAERVNNLQTLIFNEESVQEDENRDYLLGSREQDWYFAKLSGSRRDYLFGRRPLERVTILD